MWEMNHPKIFREISGQASLGSCSSVLSFDEPRGVRGSPFVVEFLFVGRWKSWWCFSSFLEDPRIKVYGSFRGISINGLCIVWANYSDHSPPVGHLKLWFSVLKSEKQTGLGITPICQGGAVSGQWNMRIIWLDRRGRQRNTYPMVRVWSPDQNLSIW